MGKLLSLSADNTYLRLLRGFILSIFLKGCIIKDIMANEDTTPTKASQQETKTKHKGKPNHLINEKSPYLLQHAFRSKKYNRFNARYRRGIGYNETNGCLVRIVFSMSNTNHKFYHYECPPFICFGKIGKHKNLLTDVNSRNKINDTAL